jgi:endonuclease/exonuclease/phosphatase family metal-dependent hydrolase
MMPRPALLSRYLAVLVIFGVFTAAPLFLGGCDTATPFPEADVTVMAYNLYLGAEIFALVGTSQEEVPVVAGTLWADVQASDFPARAEAIATIVAQHNPALIGLQEVSLYRSLTPSQFGQAPATHVELDFLAITMAALTAKGLNYEVVAVVENADVQMPATQDGGQTFFDIRLTDSDVILARSDVSTSHAVNGNFAATAPVPVGGVMVPFVRGYNHVRAQIDGVTFTFANTHLEVRVQGDLQPQVSQAVELVEILNVTPEPVILVGDFNSPADGSGTATYSLLTASYTDVMVDVNKNEPTCCQAPDLLNPTSELTTRIDLILYRGDVTTLSATTVGNQQADRVAGLWPSDHAGVVATLRIRN